jgi:hypothetical protein
MDDCANHGLAQLVVRYYVQTQGRTKTNSGLAFNFMHSKLDDALNKANKVAKHGAIKDGRFLKKFLKDMLVQLVDESRKEVHHNLCASLTSQIPCSKELALANVCYDPIAVPNLSALAKSNVVISYTHSDQVGHRRNEARRGLMMHHGFISEMQYLGDGETVDNFIHNFGKTNRVGHLETKTFWNHHNPRMDTLVHLGMNALLCLCVLCEQFHDFHEGNDYANRPIFWSSHSYHSPYPPLHRIQIGMPYSRLLASMLKNLTHQQQQQLQQKLTDAGLNLMQLKRFIGYASSNGQKQMNGNQLHFIFF